MAQQDAEGESKGGQTPLKELFDGLACDLADVLGTHTYRKVLYSEQEAREKVPVDVHNGERTRSIPPVEEARAYAEYTTRDRTRVASVQSTEGMIEAQCAPYSSVVFYHQSVVRGPQVSEDEFGLPKFEFDGYTRMQAYRALAESDRFEVRLDEADYETGDVTITVEAGGGA